jgi:hypothetical protein
MRASAMTIKLKRKPKVFHSGAMEPANTACFRVPYIRPHLIGI